MAKTTQAIKHATATDNMDVENPSSLTLDSLTSPGADKASDSGRRKPLFSAPVADWKRAVIFLLTLSLFGLSFYPALAITLLLMLNSWRHEREHFLIQLFVFGGGYGLYQVNQLPVRPTDLFLLISVILMFIMRKDRVATRVVMASAVYLAGMIVLACFGVETMRIQIYGIRSYAIVMCFMLPLLVFDRERFELRRFFQLIIVYGLVICVFYILDGFIINGWILLPRTYLENGQSTFYSPVCAPFSLWWPRKYPPGLFILVLCVYPLIHYYRFSWKQWLIVVLAFAASRTMTVIAGLVVTYLLFQGRMRRTMLYFAATIIVLTGIYFVDSATGNMLRVASTVDQFTQLDNIKDEEDLASFGSNRMAQVIPKMQMLYEKGREWIGFGFIHPELSKNNAVQLTNDLYSDIEQAEENVSWVEVTQVHTILMIGYIGLILQTAFFIILYFILKPTKLASYYLSAVVAFTIFGIGGFGGLTQDLSLSLIGLTIGVALVEYRQRRRDSEEAVS